MMDAARGARTGGSLPTDKLSESWRWERLVDFMFLPAVAQWNQGPRKVHVHDSCILCALTHTHIQTWCLGSLLAQTRTLFSIQEMFLWDKRISFQNSTHTDFDSHSPDHHRQHGSPKWTDPMMFEGKTCGDPALPQLTASCHGRSTKWQAQPHVVLLL